MRPYALVREAREVSIRRKKGRISHQPAFLRHWGCWASKSLQGSLGSRRGQWPGWGHEGELEKSLWNAITCGGNSSGVGVQPNVVVSLGLWLVSSSAHREKSGTLSWGDKGKLVPKDLSELLSTFHHNHLQKIMPAGFTSVSSNSCHFLAWDHTEKRINFPY